MTGTSIDALDAAAVRIEGEGLAMRTSLVGSLSEPLGPLAPRLRALASGRAMSAGEIARLCLDFSEAHAAALLALRVQAGHPAFVAVHGQTVFHAPPASWQMINAWPIARAMGCPVVSDLRGADLAAGGQGAPITPLADWVCFRGERETRAVINLGGFCNATLLPAGAPPASVRGLDVCACNQVLDAVARRVLGKAYDESGRAAGRGAVHADAAAELALALARQAGSGRSLGTGDEASGWIDAWAGRLLPEDLAASAADAVGGTIAGAIAVWRPDRVLLAGGGSKNVALAAGIARRVGAPVEPTDALGVPASHREAAEIAVLGALCADGVRITLPNVTRAPVPAPISGSWVNVRPTL